MFVPTGFRRDRVLNSASNPGLANFNLIYNTWTGFLVRVGPVSFGLQQSELQSYGTNFYSSL
jgi:hypothetical protein